MLEPAHPNGGRDFVYFPGARSQRGEIDLVFRKADNSFEIRSDSRVDGVLARSLNVGDRARKFGLDFIEEFIVDSDDASRGCLFLKGQVVLEASLAVFSNSPK